MPTILLTQAIVNNPPKPEKVRHELCDLQLRSLYLEVRASGLATFYLRYKDTNKKTCHHKLGTSSDITLAEARKSAKKIKAEILQGKPSVKLNETSTVPTFSDFFEFKYMPHVRQHNRTFKNDEQMYKKHLRAEFGPLPLDTIKKADVQALHARLLQSGLKPATCDHYLKLVRRVLNVALEWEVISTNPLARVQLFNADNRLERYLNEEELDRLLYILYHDDNRMVCNILLFLLSTGARLSEALHAKWSDIDSHRQWKIPQARSKSKKTRYIPLNDVARQILEVVGTENDYEYIFVNLNTGKPYTCIKKAWTRIRKEAGLSDIRIHDLRHQYASMLVNQGRSLYEVQQILGHSDPKVTERYAHLAPSTLQEAANSVSSKLNHPSVRCSHF